MRVICAAAMIAMLAGPAYAQCKTPKTLEEMMEELEDYLGPENEEELWKIRVIKLFFFFPSLTMPICR